MVPLKLNRECVLSVDIHFSGYSYSCVDLGAVVTFILEVDFHRKLTTFQNLALVSRR